MVVWGLTAFEVGFLSLKAVFAIGVQESKNNDKDEIQGFLGAIRMTTSIPRSGAGVLPFGYAWVGSAVLIPITKGNGPKVGPPHSCNAKSSQRTSGWWVDPGFYWKRRMRNARQ